MTESRSSRFSWDDAEGLSVTLSRDDERRYLALAVTGALRIDGPAKLLVVKGLITSGGTVTSSGKKRLKELLAL
jgi:hypothetical protein